MERVTKKLEQGMNEASDAIEDETHVQVIVHPEKKKGYGICYKKQ